MGQKTIQHRVQRDTSRKELAELRKENNQLKRQVARLTKLLAKAHELQGFVPDEEEEDQVETTKKASLPDENECPDCGRTLTSIRLFNKTILGCKECKYRRTAA